MNYEKLVEIQKNYFNTEITKTYFYRIKALRDLKNSIKQYESKICDALYIDLGKSFEESYMTEIGVVYTEINHTIDHLKKWMKPKKKRTPLMLFKAKSYIYSDPYGIVLILSPWNYPFQLAINPLVGAIAGGNTAIVKPSSSTPNVAKVIKEILQNVFKEEYITTILGNASEAEALLSEKVDYIFFTGSTNVGKKVMQIASNNLTPITLELGGKSPVIIDSNINLRLAAKRIAFGKLINSGQTCIAPDYVFIKEEDKQSFVKYFAESVKEFYGENPIENDVYPKIINSKHHERLMGLIEGEIVLMGGTSNPEKINPTVLDNITFKSKVMQEEIFGPILPLITYSNIEEIISILKTRPKSLALYLFTNNKQVRNNVLNSVSFGGGTVNDTLMHIVNQNIGFGGVGASGMGSYHGYNSFLTFTHQKSIVVRSNAVDLSLRYHPITKLKSRLLKKFLK